MAAPAGSSASGIAALQRETTRLASVDMLRGLVMVIMALDHTRDFFANSSNIFDPTDLSRTTPLLFFTRWITHFCAPVFVFLAGSSAYLAVAQGKGLREVAKFLISRGVWLMFLEVFVISPFGIMFGFGLVLLQVIWVIGLSMVVLGGLMLFTPSRVLGGVGILMIFAHNFFDGARADWFGPLTGVWKLLHEVSFFQPWPNGVVASFYPLVPWVGVLMAGYAAGEVMTLPGQARRRTLLWLGAGLTALFVVLRGVNVYGEPSPWSFQSSPVYTVMSFLRCSKYPPSLLYLLMTLGPALVVLAMLDRSQGWLWQRFRDFGRVPLFYYLLHFPLIHATAIVFSLIAYGNAAWLIGDPLGLRGPSALTLTDHGFGLAVVYAVWAGTVVAIYPVCRWYGGVKRRRREVIFSYL